MTPGTAAILAATLALTVTPPPTPQPEPDVEPAMVVEDHTRLPSCEEPTTLVGRVIYAVFLVEDETGAVVEQWVIEQDDRVEVTLTAAQEAECFPQPEPQPAPVVVEPEPVAEVGSEGFAERVAAANPGAVVVRVELG